MENTEWVWLKHEGHDGIARFPASVAEAMAEKGWYPTEERPVEVNPALAERPAEWFEPIPGPKPVKSSKRASASTEGTDSDG